MKSESRFLISGVTTSTSGAAFSCVGVDKFSASIHATSFGTNPATGTCNLDVKVDDSAPWTNIFSNAFNGNSNIITQFDGPFSQLRGRLEPQTTGTYTIACRYSWSKD